MTKQEALTRLFPDKRRWSPCILSLHAVLASAAFLVAAALAAEAERVPFKDHAGDIMGIQWLLIGTLFTFAAWSLVFIYTQGRKSDRAQFAVLFEKIDEMDKKMDDKFDERITHTEHKSLDHSMLCPVCRNVELG